MLKKAEPVINSYYGISGVVALISAEWVLAFQCCLSLSLFLHPHTHTQRSVPHAASLS